MTRRHPVYLVLWCALTIGCSRAPEVAPPSLSAERDGQGALSKSAPGGDTASDLSGPPTSSYSGLRLDGRAPPPGPAGYASRETLMDAFAADELTMIDVRSPLPPTVRRVSDLLYATVDNRPLKLDLYLPAQPRGNVPLLVFVHGGAWNEGRKEDFGFYPIVYAHRGYACAVPAFRPSGEAVFPAAVEDLWCALDWLQRHAGEYSFDGQRVGLIGNSSGGHLALLLAYGGDLGGRLTRCVEPALRRAVKAVVSFYGPTDLTAADLREAPDVVGFLGKPFSEAQELYRAASPISYVAPGRSPALVFHGTIDAVVPVAQSDAFVRVLRSQGIPHVYERLEGWTHAMDLVATVNKHCQWFLDEFFSAYLPLASDGRE